MKKHFAMAGAIALLSTIGSVASAQVVLDDFAAVTAVNNPPAGVGTAGTWYDSANSAFSTIATDASGGAILGDGGFTNGSYAEMDETIPATGDYTVTLEILEITEDAVTPALDGIRGIEVGVIINGVHRDENPGNINTSNPTLTAVGSSSLTFDTSDNSIGDGTSVVDTITTAQFSATAGDSIFIIIAVDVDDVALSGSWGTGASYVVDNLTLVPVTSNVDDWMLLD